MPLSERTLDLGRDAMTALLGVDAIYRRESGDQDGLAVLNLDEQGELPPDSFGTYAEAATRFADLKTRSAELIEPDRRVYYDQLCRSTAAFIAWRERGLPFEAQLREFLHVPAEPVAEPELDRLKAELRASLTRMGFESDLAAQCTTWEAHHRVPGSEVGAVLSELLSEAWDRTEAALLPIPAPKSDGMRVTPVSGVAFNARCDFLARSVEINTDPILTRPGLKHLAVHEGYPGHYLQFKLRQIRYREGVAPADVLLSVVNTASSSVFEGIADAGMAMIDWAVDADDRVQSLLNRYRAAIATGAAWRLHALHWPAGRTTDWLRDQSLTGGEGWVRNRMAFIAAPARAALIWSYWWGEPVVAAAWSRLTMSQRPAFIEFLHGRMHSNQTVGMFPG